MGWEPFNFDLETESSSEVAESGFDWNGAISSTVNLVTGLFGNSGDSNNNPVVPTSSGYAGLPDIEAMLAAAIDGVMEEVVASDRGKSATDDATKEWLKSQMFVIGTIFFGFVAFVTLMIALSRR